MSKHNTTIALVAFLLWQPAFKGVAQVSLTARNVPSGQNFNTLALSGTNSAMPAGWVFLESGTGANGLYTAGLGTGNAGDTFSYGAATNPERAFGAMRSNALVPLLGASFINNTGETITSLRITYTGEQWRLSAAGRLDRLDFQYSLDATSLNSGTWTDDDSLDFNAPKTTAPTGAVNGNDPANRVTMTHTIDGLSLAPGALCWIRWTDLDASGADDGLGIDDFFITPIGTPPEISFTAAADSVAEGDSIIVFFALSRPATKAGTVRITPGPADATYSDDFTTLPGANPSIAVPVGVGDSTLRFTVSAIDDTADELVEHITFTISASDGFEVGDQNTFILGILDNDLPFIRFEVAADTLAEGEIRTLRVLLTSPLPTDVLVTLWVKQGHVHRHGHRQDYTTSPAFRSNGKITLTIPAGDTEATFEFHASGDLCEEGNETVIFTILSVSGSVGIGSPASLAVTIVDAEPCRAFFVLHPNPTPGPVNIWTIPSNRDKVIEGSIIGPDGDVLVAATGTVHDLRETFTEVMTGARRGTYIVRLTICNRRVSLRLFKS